MTFPHATLSRFGFASEPADSQKVTSTWLHVFLLLHCGLVIPYVTDAIPAFYGMGLFPIRPALFMLALCFLNAFWLLSKGPDFTKTSLLLVLFLAFRVFDIAILQRYLFADGQKEAMSSTLALTLMATIIAASLGVARKTSSLPVILVSAASLLIQVAAVLMEFAGFFSLSTVPGRAAGLAGDSNDACMMMTLMLGVFLTMNRAFWPNLGMIAIAALGVLPTLSRGGMLSLALITTIFCLLNLRKHATKLLIASAGFVPLAALMIGLLLNNSNSGGVVDENARNRIQAIFGGDLDSMQSGERLKDLHDGFEAALLRPLAGYGTGAGQFLYYPHNQWVTLWIDVGVLGPVLLLMVLAAAGFKVLRSRGRGIYILVPLFLYTVLAQTLLDNYAYLYSLLVLLFYTSTRFFTFRISRPRYQSSCPP